MSIIQTNKTDKPRMARAFSCVAKSYDRAAFIQHTIGQRLLERSLCFKEKPQRILNIGAGTGWFAQKLQAQYPKADIIALDYAIGMCRFARKKSDPKALKDYILAPFKKQPTFVCADMENIPFQANSFDLIISNCTVEWSGNLALLFTELKRVLKTQGTLLFSTFGPDTCFELAHSACTVDAYAYTNPFLDMHHVGDILLQSRWTDPVMDREVMNIAYPSVAALVSDIRKTLSHHLVPNIMTHPNNNINTPAWLKACEQHYTSFQLADKSFPATIEIIYGYATKTTHEDIAKKCNTHVDDASFIPKIPTSIELL